MNESMQRNHVATQGDVQGEAPSSTFQLIHWSDISENVLVLSLLDSSVTQAYLSIPMEYQHNALLEVVCCLLRLVL